MRCSKCGTKWHENKPAEEAATEDLEPETEAEPEPAPPAASLRDVKIDTPPWSPQEEAANDSPAPDLADIDVAGEASADDETEATEKAADDSGGPDLTAKRDEDDELPKVLRKKPIEPEKEPPSLMFGWIALGVLVVLLLGGTFAFKDSIVRGWPAAARLYNALGMSVETHEAAAPEAPKPAAEQEKPQFQTESVTTSTETVDGVDYRVVNGTVVNTGKVAGPVPDIRTRLSGEDHKVLSETVHKLPARTLAPGETSTFTVRIASPPADARYLEVDTVPVQ